MSFVNLVRVPLAQKKTHHSVFLTCHNPMSLNTLSLWQSSLHLFSLSNSTTFCILFSSLYTLFIFLVSSILPQTCFPLLSLSPKLQIHPSPLVSISIFQFLPWLISPLKKRNFTLENPTGIFFGFI